MNPNVYKPDWQRAIITLSAVVTIFFAALLLYWARAIFIPLALAIFLAFVLAPVVNHFQQFKLFHYWKLGRPISVIIVVSAAVLISTSTLWLVGREIASLTSTLPQNSAKIKEKVVKIRNWISPSESGNLAKMFDELQQTILPESKPDIQNAETTGDPGSLPPTVVIEPRSPTWAGRIEAFISPGLALLGQLAFSFVLVIFMLLKREDLRNRMIRLVGNGRVTTVTKALDDASQRVSRYLLMQLIINVAFGITIFLAMLFLGVEYAMLWGFISILLRYVPYIGTWIGLALVAVFSFAISDSFSQPISVIVTYATLELITGNVLEPRLFGHSLGISEVAQLVAAAFWSFLWGPIGLVLSGPLTTCLLVLGKYVPQAKFLDILLGDEPALEPRVAFYQRLAARDQDEAAEIIIKESKTKSPGEVFDEVFIPALSYARRDEDLGEYSEVEMKGMIHLAHEIIEDFLEAPSSGLSSTELPSESEPHDSSQRVPIFLCPARDEIDLLGAEILSKMLDPKQWEADITADVTLTSELLEAIQEKSPLAICIVSIPPGGISHIRYLCKRIRGRFPDVKILVSIWGLADDVTAQEKQLIEAGADHVETTLKSMQQLLGSWQTALVASMTFETR